MRKAFFNVNPIDGFGDHLLLFCSQNIAEVCFWKCCSGGSWCIPHVYIYEICRRCLDAELFAPAAFRGVVAAVPAVLDWTERFGIAPRGSVVRDTSSDGRNNRCGGGDLLQLVFRVIIKDAVARTVALSLLLGQSTRFVATKLFGAVFARANNRCASAEVMAIVKTAAGGGRY
ncbi:hypothetical protein KCU71_g155, partial [Aureobasidium melanogenum]